MRFHITLHVGSTSSDHRLELSPTETARKPGEALRFVLDGQAAEADVEETAANVYSVLVCGRSYEAQVSKRLGDPAGLQSPYVVTVGLRHYLVEIRDPRRWRQARSSVEAEGPQEVVAPMPGKIVKLLVSENQQVDRDQDILVIEAMKMQNELCAPRAGRVERIYVQEGMGVETGFRLLRLV